jgi:hypothetical protein
LSKQKQAQSSRIRAINRRTLLTGSGIIAIVIVALIAISTLTSLQNRADEKTSAFEDLGIPVTTAGLSSYAVGPNQDDSKDLVYLDFSQIGDGNNFFVLAVDPDTGASQQYKSPLNGNFNAQKIILGPDNKLYLASGGTSGTPFSGHFVVFDPAEPEKGIQDKGKIPGFPDKGVTVWDLTNGTDGKIYGASGPNAALVSYDTANGQMENLGRMGSATDTEFIRTLTTGTNGKIYMSTGYTKSDAIVYDPVTKTQRSLLPADKRIPAARSVVYKGIDGEIYIANTTVESAQQEWYKLDYATDTLTSIDKTAAPKAPGLQLRDGRQVIAVQEDVDATGGNIRVWNPTSRVYDRVRYSYQGDGSSIFALGKGPDNQLYGSSIIPLELFKTEIASKQTTVLGNPHPAGAEIYSILGHQGKLFTAAYSHATFSIYEPNRPFKTGKNVADNPQELGSLDATQDRPKAMIVGPENNIYIGTAPILGIPYGAMFVVDPASGSVIERHYTRDIGLGKNSIDSLAYDSTRNLVYGGSGSRLFAWDPVQKRVVVDKELPGTSSVSGFAILGQKMYVATVGAPNRIFTIDLVSQEITNTQTLTFGYPRSQGFGAHQSGYAYGVTGLGVVFRVNPEDDQIIGLGQYSDPKRGYGAAILPDGLYFGNGQRLVKYKLDTGEATDPGKQTDPTITPPPVDEGEVDPIGSVPVESPNPTQSAPNEPLPAGVTPQPSPTKTSTARSTQAKNTPKSTATKPVTNRPTVTLSASPVANSNTPQAIVSVKPTSKPTKPAERIQALKPGLDAFILTVFANTDLRLASNTLCTDLVIGLDTACNATQYTTVWIIEAVKALFSGRSDQ